MHSIYRYTNNGIPSYSKMLIFWENVKGFCGILLAVIAQLITTLTLFSAPSRFATLLLITENSGSYSYYHISLFNLYTSM